MMMVVTVTIISPYNHLKHPPSSCSKKKTISFSVFINDNMVSAVHCTSSDIHFKHFHIWNVAGISGCILYSKKYVHVGGTNNMSPVKEEISIKHFSHFAYVNYRLVKWIRTVGLWPSFIFFLFSVVDQPKFLAEQEPF